MINNKEENPISEFSLIAGPCSAESYEQLEQTARFLTKFNVSISTSDYGASLSESRRPIKIAAMRAGVWKPRTRPDSFEGHGLKALEWIGRIKENYTLPIITEVANAEHVEQCLKCHLDMLWIGARTTGSPFAVQEIANALKGTNIPVWIKNPLSPDLGLWLGAMERLQKAGVQKVGAIHRGFGLYNSVPYRNSPLWELPIELKRLCPEIPILCDPSHIAGECRYVPELSQAAIDLEMNGLMIEIHPKPQIALSDASQQLDFDGFESMVSDFIFRDPFSASSRLEQYRTVLDAIDEELLSVLSHRMELIRQMGCLKKDENLSVLQLQRWKQVLNRCMDLAKQKDLDPQFIKEVFSCVHAESVRIQNEIFGKSK